MKPAPAISSEHTTGGQVENHFEVLPMAPRPVERMPNINDPGEDLGGRSIASVKTIVHVGAMTRLRSATP